MLALAGQPEFFEHILIYQVGAASHGSKQSASSSHRGKHCRFVTCLFERPLNQSRPIVEPRQHRLPTEAFYFLIPMKNSPFPFGAFLCVDPQLGRRRSRIDN